MMAIEWRLREIQFERNISNKQLAKAIGVGQVYVSRLRNNAPERLDIDLLGKLCKALNCQPGDLLQYKEDEE